MNDHFLLIREVRNILHAVAAAVSTEPSEGEWNRIRVVLFQALRPFDEARRAVREGLRSLGQLGELSPS
jgi:hypothetical protein